LRAAATISTAARAMLATSAKAPDDGKSREWGQAPSERDPVKAGA
jgi:hypothetical protein